MCHISNLKIKLELKGSSQKFELVLNELYMKYMKERVNKISSFYNRNYLKQSNYVTK